MNAAPFVTLNIRDSYFAAPILNIFVPHVGQIPVVAGLLFFITTGWAFFISRLALHFTQYASIKFTSPGLYLALRKTCIDCASRSQESLR
jgi:hypothetical protein